MTRLERNKARKRRRRNFIIGTVSCVLILIGGISIIHYQAMKITDQQFAQRLIDAADNPLYAHSLNFIDLKIRKILDEIFKLIENLKNFISKSLILNPEIRVLFFI